MATLSIGSGSPSGDLERRQVAASCSFALRPAKDQRSRDGRGATAGSGTGHDEVSWRSIVSNVSNSASTTRSEPGVRAALARLRMARSTRTSRWVVATRPNTAPARQAVARSGAEGWSSHVDSLGSRATFALRRVKADTHRPPEDRA